MQDSELVTNIVKNSKEAIIAIDLNGKVTFWNKSAERLFGYKEKEVLAKQLPIIKDKFNYELETILSKAKSGESLSFRTTKQTKTGEEVEVIINTNPMFQNDAIVGVSAIIQEASLLKKAGYLPYDLATPHREQKRTFIELRDLIFLTLQDGRKTINQISNDSDINWRTVEKHLTYLIGKRMVNEVFSSEYVRIFELTKVGQNYLNELKAKELQKHVKRL